MSDLGTQEAIENVYTERNLAVALAVGLAHKAGYPVQVAFSQDDPDWPVVFITLPTGQVSWHIPKAEWMEFFPPMPTTMASPWDGHTTSEKNQRITDFTQEHCNP